MRKNFPTFFLAFFFVRCSIAYNRTIAIFKVVNPTTIMLYNNASCWRSRAWLLQQGAFNTTATATSAKRIINAPNCQLRHAMAAAVTTATKTIRIVAITIKNMQVASCKKASSKKLRKSSARKANSHATKSQRITRLTSHVQHTFIYTHRAAHACSHLAVT